MSYYYLVPQLSYLVYGQEPPMSVEEFGKLARPHLSPSDVSLFDALSLQPYFDDASGGNETETDADEEASDNGQSDMSVGIIERIKRIKQKKSIYEGCTYTGCAFVDGWRAWEMAFRQNLAKERALKLKRDFAFDPNAVQIDSVLSASASGAASSAMLEATPIEGETAVNRARWNAIDGLCYNEPYFSRATIFAYLLKLLILTRDKNFEKEAGFAEYKDIYASILEGARDISDTLSNIGGRGWVSRERGIAKKEQGTVKTGD